MMKTIVRRILKITSFALIFSVLFYACQSVLKQPWVAEEDLYTQNIDFENQPKDSIDVLYFGTSELFAAVDPMITYSSEGITGYNFATTYKSAVTAYYQLLYALKHQSPKVVACDFEALFVDSLPTDVEPLYRKIYETMPDKEIKKQLLDEIMQLDPSQDYLSWKFPLLRYHSLWSNLQKANFAPNCRYDGSYPSYKKGALMRSDNFNGDIFKITPALWEPDGSHNELSDISVKYYDMFIEECKSRNIKVVGLIPPKIYSAATLTSRWDTIKKYFDSRAVGCLNYNSYDQISRMGLNLNDHYYDSAHLNTLGSVVFSKTLAADLKNEYNLEGHKNDVTVSTHWDAAYESFKEEIPRMQPNLSKCLLMISELNLNALIYINDESAVNYEKYYTALSNQGIDCDELQSSKVAVIENGRSHVITNYETVESLLGIDNLRIKDQDNQFVITINGNQTTVISLDECENIDLSVVIFDDDLMNYVSY